MSTFGVGDTIQAVYDKHRARHIKLLTLNTTFSVVNVLVTRYGKVLELAVPALIFL